MRRHPRFGQESFTYVVHFAVHFQPHSPPTGPADAIRYTVLCCSDTFHLRLFVDAYGRGPGRMCPKRWKSDISEGPCRTGLVNVGGRGVRPKSFPLALDQPEKNKDEIIQVTKLIKQSLQCPDSRFRS